MPAGDLYGDTAGAAARDLASTLERKPGLPAVDLTAVTLLTAEGLDVLPALRQDARARGVPPALLSPSRPVLRVRELTGADALFHAFGTVEEALAAHEPSLGGPAGYGPARGGQARDMRSVQGPQPRPREPSWGLPRPACHTTVSSTSSPGTPGHAARV
ncbi:STAS domain-containing protein [Streptomyces sp. NPDC127166]|uniref:STAS domain-containing protein n=1 Tax=Streptomyces sp. NPDC127166 TaxID=3345380 RepID=UPI0036301873